LLGEINLGSDFVVQPVKAMRTILPDGSVKEIKAPGYMIHRDRFDQALAKAAQDAGVELFLSTTALSREGGKVRVRKRGDGDFEISAKVIIGSDGPFSRVGRWIGAPISHLILSAQVRVNLTRPMEFTEVYFDRNIHGGYGWVFPKEKTANVGIGVKKGMGISGSVKRTLDYFLARLYEQGTITGKPFHSFGGWIPAGPVDKTVHENIILAGDAAGHTHPITGAGIFMAVKGGRMAGRWASQAVVNNDLNLLDGYEKAWQEFFGMTLDHAFKRRQRLEQEWGRLDEIIKHCWVAFREYYEDSA
jgi:geranylgeranyl reductase family protein